MRVLLVGCSLALAAACGMDVAAAPTVEPSAAALTTTNKITRNKLATNRIARNKLAANRIAKNKLATNRIVRNKIARNRLAANRLAGNQLELDPSVAGELVASPEGRELLTYTVGCALRDDQSLVAVHAGTRYEFTGAIGLAPHWVRRSLSERDQRWVSACLLARVNAHGVSVEISLRGAHRALGVDAGEQAAFQLEEGAFWGNVFAADADSLDAHACRGLDQAAGERGSLVDRDCAEPDPARAGYTLCDFEYAGDCGDFAAEAACRSYDAEGMHYTRCGASPRARDQLREVVTVFVKP